MTHLHSASQAESGGVFRFLIGHLCDRLRLRRYIPSQGLRQISGLLLSVLSLSSRGGAHVASGSLCVETPPAHLSAQAPEVPNQLVTSRQLQRYEVFLCKF